MMRTRAAMMRTRAAMMRTRAAAHRTAAPAACVLLLASCAAPRDHFYTLRALPETPRPSAAALTTHVVLKVSVPASIDRPQLVINTSSERLSILEHERWASPLSELVSQTLARDIEKRRGDVLVGGAGFDQQNRARIRITVDVVQMSAQTTARGDGRATLEAHWHIEDTAAGVDEIGGDVFSAPLEGESYASVARAYSTCLASLADRLVEKI